MLRALYRLVVRCCPAAVRDELGRDMEAAFAQSLDLEQGRRRSMGRWRAGVYGMADALAFVCASWWETRKDAAPDALGPRRRRPLMAQQDFRSTLRLMRKQPVFTAGVLIMLALGIGATTAIFSVVYGVLLKPLPFPNADRLVQVWGSIPERDLLQVSLTEANFWDLRDRNRTFDELGAIHGASFSLTGLDRPERLTAARVSSGVFRALGVRPIAGRIFEPGEDAPGSPAERVLLSHAVLERLFAGDLTIVGRAITLDGRPYTVIGVLPAGTPWLDQADVFVPFIRRPDANRGSWEYSAIGRLKAGVSMDAALDDLKRVSKDLEAQYPANKGLTAAMESARTWIASDQLRRMLWILLGAVGLLLVIACVNVTNLLLARASARVRESAVRMALGATRADLVRERLTESLVLSAIGAALGWLVAAGMLSVLKSMNPDGIPRLSEVGLNAWVLGFTMLAALLVGVLTGLVPALQAPVANIVPALRHGQRGTVGDRRHDRIRAILVAAEVALSLVLLVGAGLLVRSLAQVLSVDRGFQTENRMLLTVSLPSSYGVPRLKETTATILTRLQAMPEIQAVATVSGRPLSRSSTGMGIASGDNPDPPGAAVPWASWRIITPDYFKAMGLPLLAGRAFTDQDLIGKPWRVVISKRLGDLLWPGVNPVGRTAILWKGQGQSLGEVIGVVGDMRERGLENDPTLAVYLPAGATASTSLQLIIHTKGRAQDAVSAVRAVVSNADPTLPISNVRMLEDVVSASVGTRRFTMMLLLTFAGLALLLALAGVYGVLAYSVTRRTPEIGVRLALGAPRGRLLRLVVAQGMRPVVIGTAVGLGAMYYLSTLIASLLFGVTASDPLTYAVVSTLIVGAALLSTWWPARRASRVDPAITLRVD